MDLGIQILREAPKKSCPIKNSVTLIEKKPENQMADIREQRIYCAEQIYVPENLPVVMKHYSKAVIRAQPDDLVDFSLK